MPAATPPDRFQPSFFRLPIQNNRTGFQPVYLPLVLVVPGRRDERGFTLANSEVRNVRFFVADAPNPSTVAGPFIYTTSGPVVNNLLVPQLSRFVFNVLDLELNDVLIDYRNQTFFGPDGTVKDFSTATEGDTFQYTLTRGQIQGKIPWFPDADYYDMSLFTIAVDDLPRPQRYHFVWECQFNRREQRGVVGSIAQGAFCINPNDTSIAQYSILIEHPGEVHHEMFRKTPPFYFNSDNPKLGDDPIIQFYRPFADILQDIFDEQTFLNGINHIEKIPAQLIPYLAYLIGWDLPNFPGATDNVRRSILRQAVHLQKLKGSRRALVELFDIFGFTIDLINLWYSANGQLLVAPGETLPADQVTSEIKVDNVRQVEPLVADYSTPGFGQFQIPLLYRPTSSVMVTAFLVKPGPSEIALTSLAENIENNPDDELANQLSAFDKSTLVSMSEVTIDIATGTVISSASTTAIPLINPIGVTFDPSTNIISMNFDHYLDFADGAVFFAFATYRRDKLIIPAAVQNQRSNRFDIQILLRNGQKPAPDLIEFLLNFVFKLKGFHSLLRKIIFDLEVTDVYNVSDWCVGPGQNGGPSSAGSVCDTGVTGLTDAQIQLQDDIYNGLLEEFKAWRALDGTHQTDPVLDAKYLRIPTSAPQENSAGTCEFTKLGQNRVRPDPDVDHDQHPDTRPTLCPDVLPLPPHCFTGRVKDELLTQITGDICEIVRTVPCSLGQGNGFYWLYPQDAASVLRDGFGQFRGQNSTSFLGRKISQYGRPLPKSLHFTNRPYLIDAIQLDTDELLAYRRPSLEIQKDNLGFPSHRFIEMRNMLVDFTHPKWRAKPFDNEDDDLGAVLTTNSVGDQTLSYNDKPVIYKGNGLQPDISSLGTHEDRSFLVTHKVYMHAAPNHPAIKLDDRIVLTQENSITFDSSVPFGPIFKSANPSCSKDFITGYPAVTGRFTPSMEDFEAERGSGGTDTLLDLLDVPFRNNTEATSVVSALFTLGSEILVTPDEVEYRYYVPYRLDCDCVRYDCRTGTAGTEITASGDVHLNINPCMLGQFQLRDGTYDWNQDQLTIQQKMVLAEHIGTCSKRLDGEIPNMLCLLSDGVIPPKSAILPSGAFRFKDDYGTIFEGSFIFQNSILDIVYMTKIPYVWGEPIVGFQKGLLVFRKGIITIIHEIYAIHADGSYRLLGRVTDQRIDFFQTNVGCGDLPFADNFCYHLDCAVLDDVLPVVRCGTRWVAFDDIGVVWPDLIVDSAGNVVGTTVPPGKQPFIFMDVWGNEDDAAVTAVCSASG